MSDERLSRMEDKLDKLSEAVVEMARMEERLLTVFKRLEHMDAAFKKYDDRVDEIEKQALIRGQKIAFAERRSSMRGISTTASESLSSLSSIRLNRSSDI